MLNKNSLYLAKSVFNNRQGKYFPNLLIPAFIAIIKVKSKGSYIKY